MPVLYVRVAGERGGGSDGEREREREERKREGERGGEREIRGGCSDESVINVWARDLVACVVVPVHQKSIMTHDTFKGATTPW